LQSRHIDIVNSKVCPIERCLKRPKGRRLVYLMHLRHIKYRLRAVDPLKVTDDFQNGRFGPVEVQAGHRMKRVSPWRGKKNDNAAIYGVLDGPYEILVAAVDQFNWSVKVRNIARRQIKNGRLNLETNSFGARQLL
jgi:hypothetical protein